MKLAAVALGCAALIGSWLVGGGAAGWLYLALYALAVIPGIPLGWMLFGRRHAGGWIAGSAIGYALACIIAWMSGAAGPYFAYAAAAGWLLVAIATFSVGMRRDVPAIDLGSWTRRDGAALMWLLVLTTFLAIVPLWRIGERDGQGNRQYRAYFTADFLWHMSLTSELTSGAMPPRNPYLAPQRIHYYWTYFLFPAAIARSGPEVMQNVETCLKVNALASGLLFISAVFLAAHAVVRRAAAAAVATSLALVASSAEGTYELFRIWSRGAPWRALSGLNVDALAAWYFQGHRIDGLQRCLWYVPQHAVAYALGLVAIAAAAAAGPATPVRGITIVGLALAGSVAMNPFVGGLFALAWGISVLINALREPRPASSVGRHLIAAVPVAAALLWCISNRMVEGAGGNLVFGWAEGSRNAPVRNLMLSLGPALVPAALGLFLARRIAPMRSLLPALCMASISLLLMHTVWLSVDKAWVPFRAGQMLLAVVPAMTALILASTRGSAVKRVAAAVVVTAALLAGLPTTVIDAFNAQDVSDRGSGPGFSWTLIVSPHEQAAAEWIRTSTDRDAIVQMEPTIRDRDLSPDGWGEWWSFIPSFAQRRMAAGLPISLMRAPAYAERSQRVKEIYQTPSIEEAWQAARALRIDYLYLDARDRRVYGASSKFDADPGHFEPVFRSGEVAVYRVK